MNIHATTSPRAPAFATVPGTDYATDYGDDHRLDDSAPPPTPPQPATFIPEEPEYADSRRRDGWSAANQRRFLEALAEGHGVEVASRCVGLSASSAYAFRRTAKGATFALGWRAAGLVARDAIAETLLVRALEGTVDTVIRGEIVTTRHRFDNRLALSLLARLDRQVESAADADVKAARLVAQEFDAYLDLVGKGEGAARAGLFLARRSGALAGVPAGGQGAPAAAAPAAAAAAAEWGDLAPIYALAAADRFARTGVATAAEIDIADLDPAARAGWTAEQWTRAEAAGLVALAMPADAEPEPEPDAPASRAKTPPAPQHSQHWEFGWGEDDPVRWCDITEEWRTGFPPPPDFAGEELGEYGDDFYERTLTPVELALVEQACAAAVDAQDADDRADRDAFFASLAAAQVTDATAVAAAPTEQAPPQPVEPANQSGNDS